MAEDRFGTVSVMVSGDQVEHGGSRGRALRVRGTRRLPAIVMIVLFAMALLAVAVPLMLRASTSLQPMPTLRPTVPLDQVRSVSVDFGIVIDPDTDWRAVDARLDQVNATRVSLNAGRVEFTAFDWAAYPEAAAESGTDHLAVAGRALNTTADGAPRQVNLIVDAFIPEWIKSEPSLAGVDPDGERSEYTASAAQLVEGVVGDRLTAYVVALGERYEPNQIELTELFLDNYTYGEDDLALFRRMTGADDWPRTADGSVDTEAVEIATWRSEVMAQLMSRVRSALDEVGEGRGREIGLVLDVRVNWADPAAGRPLSGHDYTMLLRTGITLQLWVYIGRANRDATEVQELTAGLAEGGYDMSRFIVSVGLWRGDPGADPPERITPEELATAVQGGATNGITAVGVTPYSLMTAAHWETLAGVWS